jgi:hypothetical protein
LHDADNATASLIRRLLREPIAGFANTTHDAERMPSAIDNAP